MQIYLLAPFLLALIVNDESSIAQNELNLNKLFFHPHEELPPSCPSKIYCNSELLHDVQMSRIYPSGEFLLNKKLRYTESEILESYGKLKQRNNNSVPSNAELAEFVDENFEDGDELKRWTPTDFTKNPSIVDRIEDQNYKRWADSLNRVWKTLARKVKDDVRIHPDKYSSMWVPNGFIVPGGMVKELYYWDTYWIVNGLLLCDMRTTARGVIENIVSLVDQFGFMPNGGRVFYLNRSQPPMLILIVLSYYKATYDFNFIKTVITILEIEYQFWLENRMITFEKDGKTYEMASYNARSSGPRPESYWTDYTLAERYQTEKEKDDLYSHIKSAAESGWDFSSRWFITTNGTNYGNLSDTQTSNIVPVDLNSILHVNALTLSTWYNRMGNKKKAKKYKEIATQFLINIHDVMWRRDMGAWFDWDLINNKHREYFYVSNIVPLWTESYSMPKKCVANAVLRYLNNQHIIEFDSNIRYNGTPTSMYLSSQQWDFPNAWAPLQAFIIQGLDKTHQKIAQHVAEKLAEVWLQSNYKDFTAKSTMFEKYNVLTEDPTDGNEEYPVVQAGFGWTNGVVLELLDRWGGLDPYTTVNRTDC